MTISFGLKYNQLQYGLELNKWLIILYGSNLAPLECLSIAAVHQLMHTQELISSQTPYWYLGPDVRTCGPKSGFGAPGFSHPDMGWVISLYCSV